MSYSMNSQPEQTNNHPYVKQFSYVAGFCIGWVVKNGIQQCTEIYNTLTAKRMSKTKAATTSLINLSELERTPAIVRKSGLSICQYYKQNIQPFIVIKSPSIDLSDIDKDRATMAAAEMRYRVVLADSDHNENNN